MQGLIRLELWKNRAPDRSWEIRSATDDLDRSVIIILLKTGNRRYQVSFAYSSEVPEDYVGLTIDRLCDQVLKEANS